MKLQYPQNLRYSPVNWLIVDWGFNGQSFNDCGLPQPLPCPEPPPEGEDTCTPLPIREAIDTYDWARWLPEIIVGIEDPDEEIAANYAREAAIDFAKRARVLQRQILIPIQPGICTYPVEPYDGEQIVGVIGAAVDDMHPCHSKDGCSAVIRNELAFTLDVARNEIHLEDLHFAGRCSASGVLRVLVWAAPTEYACEHDVFLYEHWRRSITLEARRAYVTALHFRDSALLRVLPPREEYERAVRLAKLKSMATQSHSQMRPGSGMWGRAR